MRPKVAFIVLFFTVIGCVNDIDDSSNLISSTEKKSEIKLFEKSALSIEDIPEIKTLLEQKMGRTVLENKGLSNGPVINFNHVVKTVDTLGNTFYSFSIITPRQSQLRNTSMENLVISVDSLGNISNPFIIKFSSIQDNTESWVSNDFDFDNFNGQLEIFRYNSIFKKNLALKDYCVPEYDQNGDPIACIQENLEGGDSSGGSGAGGSYAPAGAGTHYGGSSCTYSMYWHSCGGSEGGTTHGSGECKGPLRTGSGYVLVIDCPGSTTKINFFKAETANADCPDCSNTPIGAMAVNDWAKSVLKLEYYLLDINYQMSDAELTYYQLFPDKAKTINRWLIENGRTEENLYFAKAWAKAEPQGGEINVTDRIIIDASMVNTKAKCVYDKLLRTGIDNFNEMTSILVAFSEDNYDKSTLIYRVLPDIVNSDGVRLNGSFDREDNYYYVNINATSLENRSAIEIAKTMIHESIHAKLRRHLHVGQNSFIELYGLYILNTTGSTELSHAIMRDNYVTNIANVLYQYDGGTEPISYYEDLAWEGLDQYLSPSEIDQIIQSINLARSKGLDCE